MEILSEWFRYRGEGQNGSDQLADIIDGVPFKDGIKKIERAA